jgi:hypothetical protein
MKLQVLAGAAVLALIAGGASAATHKSAGAYAEPSQPVAYAKLGDYLKASPAKRTKQDWSLGSTAQASSAPTGGAANTSATAPQAGVTPNNAPASAPDSQTAPPAQSPPDQSAPPAGTTAPPPSGGATPDTGTAPQTPGGT